MTPVPFHLFQEPSQVFCQIPYSEYTRASLANGNVRYSRPYAVSFLQLCPVDYSMFGSVSLWKSNNFPKCTVEHFKTLTVGQDVWLNQQSAVVFLEVISGGDELGEDVAHMVAVNVGLWLVFDCF